MNEKKPDFFVQSELVCVASKNLTPELSGVAPQSKSLFSEEKEKLRGLLHACEQYSNR